MLSFIQLCHIVHFDLSFFASFLRFRPIRHDSNPFHQLPAQPKWSTFVTKILNMPLEGLFWGQNVRRVGRMVYLGANT